MLLVSFSPEVREKRLIYSSKKVTDMEIVTRFTLVAVLMVAGCSSSSSEAVSVEDAAAATKERADEPAAEAGPVMTLERPK